MIFRHPVTYFCVLVLALAGCTGRPPPPATGCVSAVVGSPAAGAGRPSVTVTALDDHFDPGCIVATPGAEVTLVVRNGGHHPHDLTLDTGPSASVDRGQVAFLKAFVGTDGLRYVCTIHPGMTGHIRVGK